MQKVNNRAVFKYVPIHGTSGQHLGPTIAKEFNIILMGVFVCNFIQKINL